MVGEWLFAGFLPMLLTIVAASIALVCFPIYFWVKDRRRRGEPLSVLGLIGAASLGLLAIISICLMLRWRP